MGLYKLTYTNLRSKTKEKEIFPNTAVCRAEKDYLKSCPKGTFSKIVETKIPDAYCVRYSRMSTEKPVSQVYLYGYLTLHYGSERQVWYDGYEAWFETEKEANDFINLKKSVSNKTYGKFMIEHIFNDDKL